MVTERLDNFLNGLSDKNGNIVADLGEGHSITLNYNHRPTRANLTKLNAIKLKATEIKASMIQNMVENVNDQMQSDTLVEFASCLDMKLPIGLEDRIELLKKLHTLYGTTYCHEVEGIQEEGWKDFKVSIKYPAKIKCNQDTLVKELRNLWPTFNRLWPQYSKDKNANFMLLKHILDNYTISHPNLSVLIKILFAVSPSTGPLERSFSGLAKICYKDRNVIKSSHLETLYILAALKNPEIDFKRAGEILEKNSK